MMKYMKRFLSKILVAIVCAVISCSAIAETNVPVGDITDYGSWATEHNEAALVDMLVGENGDLTNIRESFHRQLVRDHVPVEARIGFAMMNGITHIAQILDTSLVRFVVIFLIVMYLFWIMFEAYNFIQKGDGNARQLVMDIGKKTGWLVIWIAILEIGPAQLFMSIMGPIVSIGTYLSDFILNAISYVSGARLPDTCDAIRAYATANTPDNLLIDANAAANLMCLPTRLSGFFTTAIAAGWKWMTAGIGHSTFSFVVGAIFTAVFAWNAIKFMLMALGVVMDLFLGVLLLPFTALAETIPQTSYKGLAGNIFNGFTKLFNTGPVKLDAQINRFINAAIYFVALSIVIAICAALLYGVIDSDLSSQVPALESTGFIPALLTGLLVGYLADQADKIAKDIGGGASVDTGFEKQFTSDIKTYAQDAYKSAAEWVKAFKGDKS